ncbi:MAG: hypothetical protein DHS20C08_00980 [Rhodomicrobium sp.]|nr:MAG: hypothetical protein DHS20C08_00980 [Rhodomicrobium sp.]
MLQCLPQTLKLLPATVSQTLTLSITAIACLLALIPPAAAQSIEKWDQKTKIVKITCQDYYRRPVLNVRNDTLNDVAFSDLLRHRGVHMGPMIIINYRILATLSQASQKFFITHECGHHALGHLYFRPPGLQAEKEADCYAVRTLIRQGGFTLDDIENVQEDMRKFARKTPFHPSGERRAAELLKCIEY